ncbi:hypothetical protein F3Y22_tig00110257pilonHSYRG00125 [Hibiscus syriacus]|uniref:Disease resistance protein winged helix domain-containing protein n=1 Tax=Hibiscus syriacus TaxID=106335 RepID=A0A6A3BA86_HIBSY|nr:hypothetical protein F3Y22_tig00110257pilonHSYRG00125 [Hibiscus syriacus]
MANGLLQSSNKNEEPEDIGNRYIHELWSRSFFQELEDVPFGFTFKMHDLVHDLALSVAQNDVSSTGSVRHLCFKLLGQGASLLPNNMGHLRTLVLRSNKEQKAGSEPLIDECISRSKHSLETLDLSCREGIEELPKDIRYLISLRVLAPNSPSNMLIQDCDNLISLPQGLKYLTALENLVIKGCEKLDLSMDVELGGKEDGSLRKLLIAGLPKVESLPQWILLGSTKTLQHLYILGLENLSTLPTWFLYLISLQTLEIGYCPGLSSLPEGTQRLTALQELRIEGCAKLVERCKEETGEDWPKIAHVPRITIS